MEKIITRTVTSYEHVFGRVSVGEKGGEVTVLGSVMTDKKLGSRNLVKAISEFCKAKECDEKGVILLDVKEVNVRYGMSVQKFMDNATVLD